MRGPNERSRRREGRIRGESSGVDAVRRHPCAEPNAPDHPDAVAAPNHHRYSRRSPRQRGPDTCYPHHRRPVPTGTERQIRATHREQVTTLAADARHPSSSPRATAGSSPRSRSVRRSLCISTRHRRHAATPHPPIAAVLRIAAHRRRLRRRT